MISKLSIFREPAEHGDPYRNLALEKNLTFCAEPEECILYLWQNHRTVVIGKNQNPWKECPAGQLMEENVRIARRLSGGGAVYHDTGNLNFTFCVRKQNYDLSRQLSVILTAVNSLGIPAVMTGRNDLVCEGKKFSGNAFYRSGDHCFHHGTIMADVDLERMFRYLSPDPEKLKAKGVDSVRSRVVNLKEYCPSLTIPLLGRKLEEACSGVYGLPAEDFLRERLDPDKIERDRAFFASSGWIWGRKLPFTHQIQRRFSWGDVSLQLQVNEGSIRDCVCYSDAMDQGYIESLAGRLKGLRYDRQEILASLEAMGDGTEEERRMTEDICAFLSEKLVSVKTPERHENFEKETGNERV